MKFNKGCGVCLIRLNYSISSVTCLKKVVDELLGSSLPGDVPHREDCKVFFLKSIHSQAYTSRQVYNYCFTNNKLFEDNNYIFEKIKKDDFINEEKHLIIEILCGENTDVVDLRYIYMIAEVFKINPNLSFELRFYKNDNGGHYNELESSYYMQIRTFLLLGDVNDKLFFLVKYEGNRSRSSQWQKLYTDDDLFDRLKSENGKHREKRTENFKGRAPQSAFDMLGRIFPLLNISREIYSVMVQKISAESFDDVYGIKTLLQKYKEAVRNRVKDFDNVDKIVCEDNYIEALIFYALCAYMLENDSDINFELEHEKCMDYVAGIIQTIENAYTHAVYKNNIVIGCATLVVRIRKKEDALERFAGNYFSNDDISKYFIEIYVTDLFHNEHEYEGIVNKFIKNVKNRYGNLNTAEKEEWCVKVNSDPYQWNNIEEQDISLEDMFTGGEEDSVYGRYLQLPKVIANHYGLQIFNNSISSNEGVLGVWSKGYYSNKPLNPCEKIKDWQGTAYIIYLPTYQAKKDVNYEDTLLTKEEIMPDSEDNMFTFHNFFSTDFDDKLIGIIEEYDSNKKDEYVETLSQTILVDSMVNMNDIYIVDCYKISDPRVYELIARTIFIKLVTEEHFNNIALINFQNRHQLIKLFRQFALFYNREGFNWSMNKKNVYMVDCNASIEITFGGLINDDIVNNMNSQLLLGGVSRNIKSIIEHLGRRKR